MNGLARLMVRSIDLAKEPKYAYEKQLILSHLIKSVIITKRKNYSALIMYWTILNYIDL